MKVSYVIILLFLIPFVSARIDTNSYDNFYPNSNCNDNTSFSCGTITDRIVMTNGQYLVNLSTDDNLSTYVCSTFISGPNATTKSCLIRPGFNTTSCDSFSAVLAGNHSDYYVCANMATCGWNAGIIPAFGAASPTRSFQIDTSLAHTDEVIFVSYVCNGTITNSSAQGANLFYRTISTKGTYCSGNNYESAVFDTTGVVALDAAVSCSTGSFCDPGLLANVSTISSIPTTVCTPGCHDQLKDGSETDIDYGGLICGNCSGDGKKTDEFYPLAVELQEDEWGTLTTTNVFNETAYCPVANDTGSAGISIIFLLLLISSIVIVVAVLFIVVILVIYGIIIGMFLKKKREKKP